MFDRFDDHARRSVLLANDHARLADDDEITPQHLLRGLGACNGSTAARALAAGGINPATIDLILGAERGPGSPPGHIPFTDGAKQVLDAALHTSFERNSDTVTTTDLLVAVITRGGPVIDRALGEGLRAQLGDPHLVETLAGIATACQLVRDEAFTYAAVHSVAATTRPADGAVVIAVTVVSPDGTRPDLGLPAEFGGLDVVVETIT